MRLLTFLLILFIGSSLKAQSLNNFWIGVSFNNSIVHRENLNQLGAVNFDKSNTNLAFGFNKFFQLDKSDNPIFFNAELSFLSNKIEYRANSNIFKQAQKFPNDYLLYWHDIFYRLNIGGGIGKFYFYNSKKQYISAYINLLASISYNHETKSEYYYVYGGQGSDYDDIQVFINFAEIPTTNIITLYSKFNIEFTPLENFYNFKVFSSFYFPLIASSSNFNGGSIKNRTRNIEEEYSVKYNTINLNLVLGIVYSFGKINKKNRSLD
jgi:hypothetical protein